MTAGHVYQINNANGTLTSTDAMDAPPGDINFNQNKLVWLRDDGPAR